MEQVVTDDMNATLIPDFSEGEIKYALKQMALLKALGPDGMSPIFYQKYWHIVGPVAIAGVLSYLKDGKLLQKINHTNICLIPKVQNLESVKEFRPISLCNVVYKIVA